MAGSGYDRVTRCQQVSNRLEGFRRNRQLRHITTGVINRQNVVCTASRKDGPCQGLVFTLKPGQSPSQTLQKLTGWIYGQASAPPMYEFAPNYRPTPPITSIDIRDAL